MISKSRELDQFYTKPEIARECLFVLNKHVALFDYVLIEPSAGKGAFSDLFETPFCAYDLDPKRDYIKQQDFLLLDVSCFNDTSVITVGNPPFGKNSSLAIKFFNKASTISEYIAFIVPRTFKKASVINKLDNRFHLIDEVELNQNSFTFDDDEYNVPCIFQVWQKKSYKREAIASKTKTHLFEFVSKEDADFAVRRVGGLAGKAIKEFHDYQPSSHYFIKADVTLSASVLYVLMDSLYDEFQDVARNSAGNPSLSKNELIAITEMAV